jgi:glycosyltransferase involved in cell wall biosynthesis
MFKQKKPLVSIIIPSWFCLGQNGRHGENETFYIAQACLKRLIEIKNKTSFEIELIIIDNGSTLDIPEVKEYFKNANKLIVNRENLGFAPAINEGISIARGELILQINNDILLFDNFFDQMVKDFFEQEKNLQPNIGLLMPALVKEKIKNIEDTFKKKKEDVDMQTNAGKFGIKAEFGSCYMGRLEVFKKISENRDGYQVLDENFHCGFGEDRWLYREIRMLGLETWRTHSVRVIHFGNITISKLKGKPEIREMINKNREYLEELKRKNNIS